MIRLNESSDDKMITMLNTEHILHSGSKICVREIVTLLVRVGIFEPHFLMLFFDKIYMVSTGLW